jgi:fatty acid desaturase
MHDSAHHRLATSKLLNDVFGELFCAWPMFFRMAAYRENHLLHHRYPNTPVDPDFRPGRFPKSGREIVKMLLGDVTAFHTIEQLGELKRLKKPTTLRTKLLRLAYYAALAAVLTYLGLWKVYLLYWIVPLFTWLKLVLRVRAIADHAGVETREHPFSTRTIIPNWFDRAFLAPRNCSYHLGHHLYQTVPWYNLKRLHAELMKDPTFQKRARITRGFWRLFLEFPWREPSPVPAAAEESPAS